MQSTPPTRHKKRTSVSHGRTIKTGGSRGVDLIVHPHGCQVYGSKRRKKTKKIPETLTHPDLGREGKLGSEPWCTIHRKRKKAKRKKKKPLTAKIKPKTTSEDLQKWHMHVRKKPLEENKPHDFLYIGAREGRSSPATTIPSLQQREISQLPRNYGTMKMNQEDLDYTTKPNEGAGNRIRLQLDNLQLAKEATLYLSPSIFFHHYPL